MTEQLENNFSITDETKTPISRAIFASFEAMKDAVLGAGYKLSVVIADDTLSQKLNKQYRDKDYPTDILSFPLVPFKNDGGNSTGEGEIFLNPTKCAEKATEFERDLPNYYAFVFIHGLVHLKGFDHGSTMEHEEETIRKKFGI